MSSYFCRFFSLSILPGIFLFLATPSFSDDSTPARPPLLSGQKALDRLVSELESDDSATRERAAETLSALGESARPVLEKAAESDDPALRNRARRLLEELDEEGSDASEQDDPRAERNDDDPLSWFEHRFPGGWSTGRADIDRLLAEMRDRARKLSEGGAGFDPHGSSTIEIQREENGDRWTYSEKPDGSVQATEKRRSGEEKIFEAESRDQFKEAYPELSKRLGLDQLEGARLRGKRFSGTPLPRLRSGPGGGSSGRAPRSDDADGPPGPRLGVAVESLSPAIRRQLRLERKEGALVVEVSEGSPAQRAGVEMDDIILSIDGESIGSADDLRRKLDGIGFDQSFRLEVLRDGERRTLDGRLSAFLRRQ